MRRSPPPVQEGNITVLRDGRLSQAPNALHLKVCRGDLTQLAGCIVNASNRDLELGSGVAGAIRVNGGDAIQAELDRIREKGLPNVGECVVTGGGKLKAKHVIHAVRKFQC